MGIENRTYRSIVNTVASEIATNVYNISSSKYDDLPGCFKSTYSGTVYTGTGGSSGPEHYYSHIYISVESNGVSKVSNTVNNDLVNFLASAGYTSLDTNINTKDFVGFFNNIVSFCSRYLRFATSQFSDSSYLIYGDTNNIVTYNGEEDDLIRAKSMNDVLSVLQNRINLTVRCCPVKYNYTFD